jgi:hypothetical protein
MSTFRYGFLLSAAMLLLPTVSEAMPAAPLNSGTAVTQVAQGCGSPGAWRGPNGRCHYGGYSGRRCWRGPNGGLHCEY